MKARVFLGGFYAFVRKSGGAPPHSKTRREELRTNLSSEGLLFEARGAFWTAAALRRFRIALSRPPLILSDSFHECFISLRRPDILLGRNVVSVTCRKGLTNRHGRNAE